MANETLEIYQGDTKVYTVTVTNAAGSAYNLNGYTCKFTVKTNMEDPDANALISKSGTISGDGSTGIFIITLTNTDTSIKPGNYNYDFQIYKAAAAVVKTISKGKFEVRKDVTNTSY